MFIAKNYKLFTILTLALIIMAIASAAYFGLHYGIDFTGGSILEVSYTKERPTSALLNLELNKLDLGQTVLQETDNNGIVLRARDLKPEERVAVLSALSANGKYIMTEKSFDSIGPVIGSELKRKALWGVTLVILLIVLYITFAFRKVSLPVASWKYGLIAVGTLVHDIIVPTGFYAIWTYYNGGEVDILFVTALLAILGFSIHDTIVVFDRIRENLRLSSGREPFLEIVGKSLSQTFARSINTSLTVVIVLGALLFVGPAATHNFALLLIVGIIAGTYSSIFFASPLLIIAEGLQKKR